MPKLGRLAVAARFDHEFPVHLAELERDFQILVTAAVAEPGREAGDFHAERPRIRRLGAEVLGDFRRELARDAPEVAF